MEGLRYTARYFEEIVAGIFMVLMSITTFSNVVARYIFNSPIQWAEEFSRYAFIWLVFMGAVICTKVKRHIIIDTLVVFMPARVKAAFQLIVGVLVIGLMLVMVYYGWVLIGSATQPTSTLKVPQYVVYLCVPLSALLILVRSFEDIKENLRMLAGGQAR
ncbi:MAG TPA: TRAP transporter small permease [Chloroflexota bacterium]|nr:TRAP transporter small permease [Chloroflexota bacterium]